MEASSSTQELTFVTENGPLVFTAESFGPKCDAWAIEASSEVKPDIPERNISNLWRSLHRSIVSVDDPDIEIHIGDAYFKCHSMLLNAYTDFFAKFSHSKVNVINPDFMTADCFIKLYNWLRNDDPTLNREGLLDLLIVGTKLKMEPLVRHCWVYIDDSKCYTELSAFELYLEARTKKMTQLMDLMIPRLTRCFLFIVSTKEFIEFSDKEVLTLLDSNTLGIHTEIEVFYAAIFWMVSKWPERLQYAKVLMPVIRFNLMPVWFLIYMLNDSEMPEIKSILKTGISPLMFEAMALASQNEAQAVKDRKTTTVFKGALLRSGRRSWIVDELCPYYTKGMDDTFLMQNISFEKFLAYVKAIGKVGKDHVETIKFQVDEAD